MARGCEKKYNTFLGALKTGAIEEGFSLFNMDSLFKDK
jgi:hypothetical protein